MPNPFSIADPGTLFYRFHELGNRELATIRQVVADPHQQKQPRTWSITEAAELIGRSLPWVREHSASVQLEIDDAGRKRFSLRDIDQLRELAGTLYRRPAGSSMMVAAITNFKGGSGKTTTIVHLAQYMAIMGLRALVIDADPQASATLNISGIIPDVELEYENIANEALLQGDPALFRSVIRQTYFPGVDLVPANLMLQDLDLALPNPDLNNHRTAGPAALRLKRCLEGISDDYDIVLIDCPPNMGALTTNAIVAANGLLIPVPPFSFDRASFVMLTNSLSNLYEQLNRPLDYFRILITKHPKTQTAILQQETRIRQLYGDHVLSNCMYQTTEIEKATTLMSSVYDQERPLNKRDTFIRALDSLNAVNGEILADFKTIWEQQSHDSEKASQ